MTRFLCFVFLCFCFLDVQGQVSLSSGLQAYYPFNGTFNDASGNGNHGTGHGGVSFGTDQWGNPNNAASFDGVDDWIEVAPDVSITPGQKLTVAFRVFTKLNSNVGQSVVAKSDIGSYYDFSYQISFNAPRPSSGIGNGIMFGSAHQGYCTAPTLASYNYLVSGTALDTGKWYCVVVVFDSGVKKIFVNGVLMAVQTVTGVPVPNKLDSCSDAGLKFGFWHSGEPQWLDGLLDEVRIYNRVLNSQEIDSLCKLVVQPQATNEINSYAAVLGLGPCENSFLVDDTAGFSVGDTVLMIQMKGALVDSSNNSNFGIVKIYGGSGNYEKNVIKSVGANSLSLLYEVKRHYDIPNGRVQFVSIPFFKQYTVSKPLTCKPWNGQKGGVFAIGVSGTLNLLNNIDVSGKGFRGGIANSTRSSTKQYCGVTDYYLPPTNDSAAEKGEGIVELGVSRSFARGAAANGGGGGNATNAGGGGGGNAGQGGLGGMEYGECNTTRVNVTGGLGGSGLSINGAANKIFLGGGGGAGQANDLSTADGGAGGGIIFIQANKISSFSRSLLANGNSGRVCVPNSTDPYPCWDGMGGGGAGGTVIVDCPSFLGTVNIAANGGNGADVIGTSPYPFVLHGPGGGGGGGVLWVTAPLMPSALNFQANGGVNGVNVNRSNDAYGAKVGTDGFSISNLKVIEPVDTFHNNPATFDFSFKIVGCYLAQFTSKTPTNAQSYSWQFGSFGSSNQKDPLQLFPGEGSYQVTLTITDANGCTYSITKNVVISAYKGMKIDTTICSGQSIVLSILSGNTFNWTPSTGLSTTNTASTIASPLQTTTYYATVSNGAGCEFVDTFVVNVIPTAVANFSYLPNPTLANTPVQFQSRGLNANQWYWDFGDGTKSSEPNPKHLFLQNGYFNVCLVMSNNGRCPDTICQTVQGIVKKFVGVPSAFTPNGDNVNDVLFVRGTGLQSVHLLIFNRWGQKVFETADINQGWDGSFKGKQQDIDAFAYVLTATFIDGSSEIKKGSINLLR